MIKRQTKLQFILTGSSARKLKRSGANLLAGRAVQRFLYPFTFQELGNAFHLKDALVYGTLPAIFGLSGAERHDVLKTYTQTYLREEIQQEGIARNIGGFSKFLDIVASQCGEVINFAATARECLLPNKTVQSYYEILEDTLVGVRLGAWSESTRRRLVTHSKFYLFDTGITNAITHRLTDTFDASLLGRLFEQWVVLETNRFLSYKQSEARLWFWRTNHGAEVDLLIEKHGKLIAACEIKSTQLITGAHLSGLRSFREEYPKVPLLYVISQTANAYSLDHVKILPWQHFFEQLTKWV